MSTENTLLSMHDHLAGIILALEGNWSVNSTNNSLS